MKTDCSVYQHRRIDTNTIFYVGKASNKYRKDSKADRNKKWQSIVEESNGFYSEIVVSGVDEELALFCEQEYIDKLRRLGIGLCNLTSGGQGKSGWNPSEETRRLWSEQRKNRAPHNKGTRKPYVKKTPEELAEIRKVAAVKQSIALKGRIPWNKGLSWQNHALRGRPAHNKGKRVIGSRRWLQDQRKASKQIIEGEDD